jgi:enoyl-CoA hydratase
VIVLAGNGPHFCAGHDIGTPGRDADESFECKAVIWWDHTGRDGVDRRLAREQEVYLGMCRRWKEIPKPMIAMVQGACIATHAHNAEVGADPMAGLDVHGMRGAATTPSPTSA